MLKNKKKLEILINKLTLILEKSNFIEFYYIMGSKKEIIKRNLLAGIFRGVGIGIGVTLITTIIIYLLQKIVLLNIPVIGEYINDVIEIVEKSR